MATNANKRAGKFTVREIEGATLEARSTGKHVWLTDVGARGEGRFTCRCTPAGSRIFMYRYINRAGKRDILRVAGYDPKGIDGLTLEQARRKAGEWAVMYQDGEADLREHFNEKAEAVAAVRAEKKKAVEEADRKTRRGSLSALIDAYVATLAGRPAAYDAENLLRRHVKVPFPELVARQAAGIAAEELRDVLARLIDQGKGRSAGKARAYLRAAYGLAMRAGLDPTVPQALSAFEVKQNPLDRLPSLSQFNKALNRALTLPELRAFWRRFCSLNHGPAHEALAACVLLGGQRPMQLLRITSIDVDLSGATVTILDTKGRNRHANPRLHVVPIPDLLQPVLRRLKQRCVRPLDLIFPGVRMDHISGLVNEICASMDAARELERGSFQLRDLRRTAETHLAAMKVSKEVRAQLQSHGLGGIQDRHYDRHDYMDEKRAALVLWVKRLDAESADVVAAK